MGYRRNQGCSDVVGNEDGKDWAACPERLRSDYEVQKLGEIPADFFSSRFLPASRRPVSHSSEMLRQGLPLYDL